jgi:biotin carboxyl carrier protein
VPDGRSDGPSKSGNRELDLAAIDSLIDRLVPALAAKLATTHLGELEVREGGWRIRLRRPATAGSWNGEQRRSSDRAGRAAGSHDGHAPARAGVDSHRVPTPGGSNGASPGSGASAGSYPAGQGSGSTPARPSHEDETRRVATSPAVGVFRPNARATVGTRVREGDALGHVDVLGIREEVLSPVDGLVGQLIAEAGTAVEYGQELVVVALTGSGAPA